MPDIIDPQYALLREAAAAAWPETKSNGIYEADHVEMIPWEGLLPPYAVIAIDSMAAASGGSTNDVYEIPVDFYYVAATDGPLSGLRERLDALRRALNHWDQEKLQVVQVDRMSWSRSVGPNDLFASKNMSHRAGMLRVTILAGDNLNDPEESP